MYDVATPVSRIQAAGGLSEHNIIIRVRVVVRSTTYYEQGL